MSNVKVLGLALNLRLINKNVSGTRNVLNVGLRDRDVLVDIIDVELYGLLRKILILRNFHYNLNTWKLKYHLDPLVKLFRSRNAEKLVRNFLGDYNCILQVGSEFDVASRIDDLNCPVFSYHDNNLEGFINSPWVLPNISKKLIKRAFEFEYSLYTKLTGIFTITDYLRSIFIESFNVQPSKVHSVGVAANINNQVLIDSKEYDGQTVLFVARHLFKQKGGYVLLDAFRKVKKAIPAAKLFLVGQDIDIDQPGVQVIGFLDKKNSEHLSQLQALYTRASLFVMPSFNEASGNVFFEAMSHRVPCIGTDCCAMPEIITGNNAGSVVPPGDSSALASKMIELLSDKSKLRTLGSNGFDAIRKKYNWEIVTSKIITQMEKSIGKK